MGETARERFRRIQAEAATGVGKEPGGLGGQVVEGLSEPARRGLGAVAESARVNGPGLHAALLLSRQQRLAERMADLGVPVVLAELPNNSDELADLERCCAEQERNAK